MNEEELRKNTPSGPMFVSFTPRDVMNSRALLTFSAFWTRMRGALLYLPNDTSPVRKLSHDRGLDGRDSVPIISYKEQGLS